MAPLAKSPFIDKFYPDVFAAMGNVTVELDKVFPEVDIDKALVELVCVRVSQINRCAFCLSVHTPRARKAGVSNRKLDILAAWREAPEVYTAQELAALELADTLTTLPDHRRNGDAALKACDTLAEEQVAALEWLIVLMNAYNRISIASGHPPRKY